jgi:high-affinity K+ transport system ATPase subunit B
LLDLQPQPKDQQRAPIAHPGTGTPTLAQADVGVAMNTGTQAAKEAGNMIDLDSNPTRLLEVGKQLLMTRGTLTTFSIANDVAMGPTEWTNGRPFEPP